MKKLYKMTFWIVAILIWTSPITFAADFALAPSVVYRNYQEADSAFGVGLSADVKNRFEIPVVFFGGIEYIATEKNNVDGSLVCLSAGAGYDYSVEQVEGLTIRPYASIDFAFIDAESGFSAKDDVGFSVGTKASYAVLDNVNLFAGIGYQWLDTKISQGIFSQKVSLDNLNFTSGVSIEF